MMSKQTAKRNTSDVSVASAIGVLDVPDPLPDVQQIDAPDKETTKQNSAESVSGAGKTYRGKTGSGKTELSNKDSRKIRPTSAAGSAQRFAATHLEDDGGNRQAELFYLQKQIQQQTQMVFILEDGARIQGIVEWYDRHSIKVRGKSRVLIYKSAIKYLYKAGELGSAPEH